MPSPSQSQLTALVTGASSGLGEALARELSARGLRLLLVSENAPELERVRGELAARGEVRALVLDLRVCALIPGGIRTNFFANNRIYLPGLVAGHLASPQRVARAGLRALFRGRRRLIPGWRPRLHVLLFKALLTPALFGFSRRLYARLRGRD